MRVSSPRSGPQSGPCRQYSGVYWELGFRFRPYENDPWLSNVSVILPRRSVRRVEIMAFGRTLITTISSAARNERAQGSDKRARSWHFGLRPTFIMSTCKGLHRGLCCEIDKAREFCENLEIRALRVDTSCLRRNVPEEYERCFHQLRASWSEASERCRRSDVTLIWSSNQAFG